MTSPRALGGDAVTSLGKAVNSGGGRACADTGPGALRLRPAPSGSSAPFSASKAGCCRTESRGARAQSARSAPGRGAALRCGAAHAQEAAESGTPRPPTGALLTRLPWFSRSPVVF